MNPRSLSIAVLAAGCAALLGACDHGSGESQPSAQRNGSGASVETRLRVEGGARVSSALRERFRLARLRGVEILPLAQNELIVRAPARLQSAVDTLVRPGAIRFYDWEPNVLGDRGPDTPYAGGTGLFQAVRVAAAARPKAERSDLGPGAAGKLSLRQADRRNDALGARLYLFDVGGHLIAGPVAGRAALRTSLGGPPPKGSRLLTVPRGIVVLEAERVPGQPDSVRRFYVLEDDAELSGRELRDARQAFDEQTGEPILTADLSARGRRAFAALTRRVARRGSNGGAAATPQRFAVALDDRVLASPAIDFRVLPEGIDARNGIQLNGLGSPSRARAVATLVTSGPLPGRLTPLTHR